MRQPGRGYKEGRRFKGIVGLDLHVLALTWQGPRNIEVTHGKEGEDAVVVYS